MSLDIPHLERVRKIGPFSERMLHPIARGIFTRNPNALVAEFGTASGETTRIIRQYATETSEIHTFDWFHGLPEFWRDGFGQGSFSRGGAIPDDMEGIEIHNGKFEDTLPEFVEYLRGKGRHLDLLHVDCDLYSSTDCIFKHLSDFIGPDTVILFDELIAYPGWEQHEYKALVELLERENWIVLDGETRDEFDQNVWVRVGPAESEGQLLHLLA